MMARKSEHKQSDPYCRFKTTEYKITNNCKFQQVELGRIKAEGWLKEQLSRGSEGIMGRLDELDPLAYYYSYIHKNLDEMRDKIWNMGSEYAGNYWLGLIQLAYVLDSESLKRKAEIWLEQVIDHQESDGYIGSFGKKQDKFHDFNAWGICFIIKALILYYETLDDAAKKQRVLDACRKGLMWFVNNWPGEKKLSYVAQNLIEVMLLVYSHTGEEIFRDYAFEYMEWLNRNKIVCGMKFIEYLKSDKLYYNSNHAVAFGEDLKLPAIVYSFNGNEEYLRASKKGIRKVIDKCFQETGAPSSNVESLSPPGTTCETEYCNFVTYAETFTRLAAITGEAQYGDFIEKIVFNGAEGARKKDEKALAYMTSPNQMAAHETSTKHGVCPDMQLYTPLYHVRCCHSHSARIIPEYVRNLCMTDKEGALNFVCYGPCSLNMDTINGSNVNIEEITEYPFKEHITLKLYMDGTSSISLKMNFRIPGWCTNASIRINGIETEGMKRSGKYYSVERMWNSNDVIEIHFPMEVVVVEVDDSSYMNKKPIAFKRGPLLFSLKIEEKWEVVPAAPKIPYPVAGWHWYKAVPDVESKDWLTFLRKYEYAVNESCLKIMPDSVAVEVIDIGESYPWERSPVSIRIPMKSMVFGFNLYPVKTLDVYTCPAEVSGDEEMIELVPYGCTTLRISYFPRYIAEDAVL